MCLSKVLLKILNNNFFSVSLWKLEKCAKYLDAVIYNISESLHDEKTKNQTMNVSEEILKELEALKLKKMKFLIHSYLQYCAILSQINK